MGAFPQICLLLAFTFFRGRLHAQTVEDGVRYLSVQFVSIVSSPSLFRPKPCLLQGLQADRTLLPQQPADMESVRVCAGTSL